MSEPSAKGWNGLPAGKRLSEALLSEAIGLLPSGIENLIVIPDGALVGLPFETLPLPQVSSGAPHTYLIAKYSVSYGASCSSLLFLKERERKGPFSKGLLAMGDPLYVRRTPAERNSRLSEAGLMQDLYESQGFRLDPLGRSRAEARRIAALFPERMADVYLKGDASVSRLKSLALENYQVIHLACHAYEDEMVPYRSGLFLSAPTGCDDGGFLYARDVAGLSMRAELVVLSACRTSRGYIEDGEGAMGLARAFFYAGARSVVSSLWEVSDRAAAEIMPRILWTPHGAARARRRRSARPSSRC